MRTSAVRAGASSSHSSGEAWSLAATQRCALQRRPHLRATAYRSRCGAECVARSRSPTEPPAPASD
jgi:hypothetical protein